MIDSPEPWSCPICGDKRLFCREGRASANIYCDVCGIYPYRVVAGAYVHTADSYHIYGNDITRGFEEDGTPIPGDFVNKFLTSLELPRARRFWDLSTPAMAEIMAEGEEKERKLAQNRGSD